MAGLKGVVCDRISSEGEANRLFGARTLEEGLSWIRSAKALLQGPETLDGFNRERLDEIDALICNTIVDQLKNPTQLQSYENLGLWLSGVDYSSPVELFSVNYDVLAERGLEGLAVPYFDGFVGSIKGRFRDDLIEPGQAPLPPSFARLWKLHGSINWVFDEGTAPRRVVRLGRESAEGEVAAIYPSNEKYEDSRRVPFVVLMDRFRRALSEPESILMVNGYSFGDDHLNELMFEAAQRHPRNSVAAFCYDTIPEKLASVAVRTPSVSVIARKEYIIGGTREQFSPDEDPVRFISDGPQCLLGDFSNFAGFLAQREGENPVHVGDAAQLRRLLGNLAAGA